MKNILILAALAIAPVLGLAQPAQKPLSPTVAGNDRSPLSRGPAPAAAPALGAPGVVVPGIRPGAAAAGGAPAPEEPGQTAFAEAGGATKLVLLAVREDFAFVRLTTGGNRVSFSVRPGEEVVIGPDRFLVGIQGKGQATGMSMVLMHPKTKKVFLQRWLENALPTGGGAGQGAAGASPVGG